MLSYLPTPPSEEEKRSFIDPRGSWLGLVGLISLSCYCFITLQSARFNFLFGLYAIFAIAYFFKVGFWAFGAWFAKPLDYEQHCSDRESFADYVPSVDIYLPNCGEAIEVIANQFKYVRQLDYPNYTVYVLDDKGSEDVKLAADLSGFKYISRPNKGELKKAGNLRYAFPRSDGDLILVLDADFVPRPDFLKETVFRFALNPKLGILQTPQYFGNDGHQQDQTDAQLGLGFFQEAFYRLVQNFRDRLGKSAICCGSCAVYRRDALAPFGGAAAVHRSEDVHTGVNVLSEGWDVEYLPLNLSAGLSPENVKSLFNQHYRWCSGSYSLTCSIDFWKKPNIGLFRKLMYFSAFFYYSTSALGVMAHAIPVFLGLWVSPDIPTSIVHRVGVPSILLIVVSSALWAKSRWGLFVPVMGMAVSYTHLIALFDVLFGEIAPWVPSGVASASNGRFTRFLWCVGLIPVVLFAIALLITLHQHVNWHRAIFPLCWMGLQMILSWVLLFQVWREHPRSSEVKA